MTINFLANDIKEELKKISENTDEEVCGFLIKDKNSYVFKQCQNIHPDPKNYFLICPKQYNFDDETILFHSHPKHTNDQGFSDWDLENQFYFCLPMLLYSVNNNKFYYKEI